MFPTRFRNLAAARVQFGDRVDRFGAYLLVGDEAADRALESIEMRDAHRVIDDALAGRVAPAALTELVASARVVPPWVEWDRVERGGRFFLRTGIIGGIVLGAKALITSYASPAGNKPLVFSGRLREAAAPRLHETSKFVRAIVQPGGMRVGAEGWSTTLRVRLMHAQVRRMLFASSRWQTSEWGLPINQHDMVAASLVFSVVTLAGVRLLGIEVSEEESDDFMHLWRWVSHVIGVDDALYPGTEQEAERLAALIHATQGPPDEDSRALTDALLHQGEQHPKAAVREHAKKTLGLARSIVRHLIGDELADQLALPRSRERYLLPAAIATMRGLEQARRRSARLEEAMVQRGARYWDNVIENGLVYATRDFELPTRLGVA